MPRAAVMSPRSTIRSRAQPKVASSSATSAFAPTSFPHRKTSCSPGIRPGSTMTLQLTVFSAFTTRVATNVRWICSPRLSPAPTTTVRDPDEVSIGLATSTSVFPARSSGRALPIASRETRPPQQLKRSSPCAAASANVPWLAPSPADATHSAAFSLPGVREPSITSWPSSTSFVASVVPTIPVPRTPIRTRHQGYRCPVPRKVMLIGLDCAEPSLVLERWRDELPTLSGLMERGSYGRLTSVIPPITVPAWSCMMASKTPGDLGVYGFRNRSDHTYDGGFIAMSDAIREPRLWDLVTRAGGSSVVLSVPGTYP